MIGDTLRWGTKSEATRGLQSALLYLGYDLPKYGADGWLGSETEAAAEEFNADHSETITPCWLSSDDGHMDIDGDYAEHVVEMASNVEGVMQKYHVSDQTDFSMSGNVHGRRTWEDITGIVLHQTGVWMTDTPKRFRRLRAHVGVLRDGETDAYDPESDVKPPCIVLVHDLNAYLWHANSLNKHTVGIEVNGHYEGLVSADPKGKRESGPPSRQIENAQRSVSFVCALVAAHGGMVREVFPHRVASMQRRSDPGEAIWQGVGMWAQEKLGLSDGGPGFVHGGRPIPNEWDHRYNAEY